MHAAERRLPYQHDYHAGNFADVVKHTVLLLLMQRMATVHIDARDSCSLPRVSGGLRWAVTIRGPPGPFCNPPVRVDAVDDLGDGVSRVRFMPYCRGRHVLTAALPTSGGTLEDGFNATFDINFGIP